MWTAKNLLLAATVGVLLAVVFGLMTTTKYPPCDLVAMGTKVPTFGCSYNYSSSYPCRDKPANSSAMASCVLQHYYRLRTFPFGFTQTFGPHSNRVDATPLNENRMASFALGVAATLTGLAVWRWRRGTPQAE